MLYTQIGLAFLAGVAFAVALIPVNRWIANKIGSLSVSLMTAKDARVSLTSESINGAKQIKLLAWEDVFIEKIQGLQLKTYFWKLVLTFCKPLLTFVQTKLQSCVKRKWSICRSESTWTRFASTSGPPLQF